MFKQSLTKKKKAWIKLDISEDFFSFLKKIIKKNFWAESHRQDKEVREQRGPEQTWITAETWPASGNYSKQYLSLFDLFDQVLFGLVGSLQLHCEVVHHPLCLFPLQLHPLSQLDLLLQRLLLINQLTRDLNTHTQTQILNLHSCQRCPLTSQRISIFIKLHKSRWQNIWDQRQLRLMGVFSAINSSLGSVPLPAVCWRGPAVFAPPAPSPAGTPPAPPPSARCPRAASAVGSALPQPVWRPAGRQPAGNTHRVIVDVQFYDKHEAEFGSSCAAADMTKWLTLERKTAKDCPSLVCGK